MLKISGPVGAIGFVSVFLLSGAGASLSIDSARADTCLAAPKTAAPSGQHWYYHIDRATRHKCWYLHGAVQLHHHTLIRHHAAEAAADAEPAGEPQTAAGPQTAAAPAAMADPPAQPVAPPTAPAAAPDSAAGNAAAAPHVTVLAVRPSTPFVSTAAAPQRSAPETPPAPPTQQPALHDESTPAGVSVKPADGPQSAQRQDKADATYNAPAQSADAATNAARTRTAEMFILLALVFGAAAAVIAIVSKVLGMYRRPRISDDPDAAWLRYRSWRVSELMRKPSLTAMRSRFSILKNTTDWAICIRRNGSIGHRTHRIDLQCRRRNRRPRTSRISNRRCARCGKRAEAAWRSRSCAI